MYIIGPLENIWQLIPQKERTNYAIIFDTAVHKYAQTIADKAPPSVKLHSIPINSGEEHKSMDQLALIFEFMADFNMDRSSVIIAVGGGMVGDLAGFAAASYMRGIDIIHVPTTLMAMVDSSIGGKSGVNLRQGKNLVGAFHEPILTYTDPLTLKTLSINQFRAGLAEMIKYGIIEDEAMLIRLADGIRVTDTDLLPLIQRCVAIKERVVDHDPKERLNGERGILNFGHTIGHAIEQASKYKISHGEAVAIGMHGELHLSNMPDNDREFCVRIIKGNGLPIKTKGEIDLEEIYHYMRMDKKNINGEIRFSLVRGIGLPVVHEERSKEQIMQTLNHIISTPLPV